MNLRRKAVTHMTYRMNERQYTAATWNLALHWEATETDARGYTITDWLDALMVIHA